MTRRGDEDEDSVVVNIHKKSFKKGGEAKNGGGREGKGRKKKREVGVRGGGAIS